MFYTFNKNQIIYFFNYYLINKKCPKHILMLKILLITVNTLRDVLIIIFTSN